MRPSVSLQVPHPSVVGHAGRTTLRVLDGGALSLRVRPGTLVALEGACALGLSAEGGVLWVTQTGDMRDHLIRSGARLELPPGGKVVVGALQAADLTIEVLGGPSSVLDRLRAALRRLVARRPPRRVRALHAAGGWSKR